MSMAVITSSHEADDIMPPIVNYPLREESASRASSRHKPDPSELPQCRQS